MPLALRSSLNSGISFSAVVYFLACLSDILSCFAISALIFLISPFSFFASYSSLSLEISHLFTSMDVSRTSWLADISIISSSISEILDFSTLQGIPDGNSSLYSLSDIMQIALKRLSPDTRRYTSLSVSYITDRLCLKPLILMLSMRASIPSWVYISFFGLDFIFDLSMN